MPEALQLTDSLSRSNASRISNEMEQVFIGKGYEIPIYLTSGKTLEIYISEVPSCQQNNYSSETCLFTLAVLVFVILELDLKH